MSIKDWNKNQGCIRSFSPSSNWAKQMEQPVANPGDSLEADV